MGLQQAIDRCFGDEVALGVGEADRQLPRRELRALQGPVDDTLANLVRDPVPDTARSAVAILQAFQAEGSVAFVPSNGMDGSPSRPSG